MSIEKVIKQANKIVKDKEERDLSYLVADYHDAYRDRPTEAKILFDEIVREKMRLTKPNGKRR